MLSALFRFFNQLPCAETLMAAVRAMPSASSKILATINGLWPLNERIKQERPMAVKQQRQQQKKQLFKGKDSRKSNPRVPYNSSSHY